MNAKFLLWSSRLWASTLNTAERKHRPEGEGIEGEALCCGKQRLDLG